MALSLNISLQHLKPRRLRRSRGVASLMGFCLCVGLAIPAYAQSSKQSASNQSASTQSSPNQPHPAPQMPVVVYAAASLKNVLDAISLEFEQASGITTQRVYAGTSALARQIEHGAPADIFISANPLWMDYLDARGLITSATRQTVAHNRLVVIRHGRTHCEANTDGIRSILTARQTKIATALVEAIPAGMYAKSALTNMDLWPAVKNKLVQADNVRAAFQLVNLGAVPIGIVYLTDVHKDANVSIISHIDPSLHEPITYPAAVVRGRATSHTSRFLNFLSSPRAIEIFTSYNFKQTQLRQTHTGLAAPC